MYNVFLKVHTISPVSQIFIYSCTKTGMETKYPAINLYALFSKVQCVIGPVGFTDFSWTCADSSEDSVAPAASAGRLFD